jgi:methionyl-tRNA synthetase
MVFKYREGHFIKKRLQVFEDVSLKQKALDALPTMIKYMDALKVSDALEVVVDLARAANKYIDLTEPWKLNGDINSKDILDHVLYELLETIRFIGVLLQPFIPETGAKILNQLDVRIHTFDSLKQFGELEEKTLDKPFVLFERFKLEDKMMEILK